MSDEFKIGDDIVIKYRYHGMFTVTAGPEPPSPHGGIGDDEDHDRYYGSLSTRKVIELIAFLTTRILK